MKRSIHREVLHQIPCGVEDVYESALSFLKRCICDPDLPIDGLNAIGSKILGDFGIIKGLNKVEGTVEHVDPAIRAIIGRIQKGLLCSIDGNREPRVNGANSRSICRYR